MIDEDSSYWDSVDGVDRVDGDSDLFENNFDLISSSYRVASAETHIVSPHELCGSALFTLGQRF